MKKNTISFAAGILVGALLFGGTAVYAAEAVAKRSSHNITVDGKTVQAEAYTIGGSNYFKLRDIGQLVDFGVTWNGATQTVAIDTTTSYVPEVKTTPEQEKPAPSAAGKTITSRAASREDFSQQANPDVFIGGAYTRENYNAIRQSIVDREIIAKDSSSYAFAHSMVAQSVRSTLEYVIDQTRGLFQYSFSAEKNLKNYYEYPDYFIVAATLPDHQIGARTFISSVIEDAKMRSSDAEKVRIVNDYLCDLVQYDVNATAGISRVFSEHSQPVAGQCSSYGYAFNFLCDAIGIPCIMISSETHSWNAVYADGQWLYVDVSRNDLSETRSTILLASSVSYVDREPNGTAFAKELLVPGSTSK